ncbi:MAG: hypothetical protein ACQ5SW_02505 [Sphaerochaetaceae bacterium]
MIGFVQNINRNILRECRLQIDLTAEEVMKKIPKIVDIEAGKRISLSI